MTTSDDNKRWAKEARSHRQALKKAGAPQATNLFMARLSRQQGISRAPSRGPWFILLFLALSAVAVYWAYSRYYLSHGFASPAGNASPESTVSLSTETATVIPEISTPTVSAMGSAVVAVTPPEKPRVVTVDSREWKGPASAIRDARAVLIQGRTRWKALWSEMGNTDAAPRINFADYVVVGAFGGPRTPGSEVIISDLQEHDKSISIAYHVNEAQTAPGAALEPIYPFHIKIVIRSEKPVRFILDPKKP